MHGCAPPLKCLLLLLDGLGDRSHPELGGQTPLAKAHTPHLDRIAAAGANGLYHPARPGLALPSERAHYAMFGCTAAQFPGRGYLEALGMGLSLAPDEVCLLAHFGSVASKGQGLVLVEDSPRATPEEAEAFAHCAPREAVDGLEAQFVSHRGLFGVLRVRGGASPLVTDTGPMLPGLTIPRMEPLAEAADDTAARRTAAALTSYLRTTARRLAACPANAARRARGEPVVNFLLTQRAGRHVEVEPFPLRLGLAGASVSSGAMYAGMAAHLGMTHRDPPRSNDPGEELAGSLRLGLGLLHDHDFVHVHTKAPDKAAHAKNPQAKVAAIEALDRGLGEVIDELLSQPGLLVAVAADHSTPSRGSLIHSGEWVPLCLAGPGVRRDPVIRYCETAAACGALGCVRGREFMFLVLNHLDRAKLATIRDSAADRPYFPGDSRPFTLEDD